MTGPPRHTLPLLDGIQAFTEFHSKVLFNHDQYNGDEAAFSIGGFQDLKTNIMLKNGSLPLYAH
jgi:hypothetical protein